MSHDIIDKDNTGLFMYEEQVVIDSAGTILGIIAVYLVGRRWLK